MNAKDKTITLKGRDDNGDRISSKELEEMIQAAARESGKIRIEAFGQHNIGGRVRREGGITFTVSGPIGQRLGSMGQPGTTIIAENSASDDVGYLNIGADIIVRGDATNGVANAMAQGRIMIGGSIGARGLTMTKLNPAFQPPELWVLGSVGDSFAEFNCGGIGIVCGVEPKNMKNVLGYRPCVGMVGGRIFFRGETDGSYARNNAILQEPDDEKWQWLMERLPGFLAAIGRKELLDALSVREEWQVLEAIPPQDRALYFSGPMPMSEFKEKIWNPAFGGNDPLSDIAPGLDRSPIDVIVTGELRRRRPYWANQPAPADGDAACPAGLPASRRLELAAGQKLREAYSLALGYIPAPATVCGIVCQDKCDAGRKAGDPVSFAPGTMGRVVRDSGMPAYCPASGHRVAVIGAGPAGMAAAWTLAQAGISASLYEAGDAAGGMMARIIPDDRLARAVYDAEMARFARMPNLSLETGHEVRADEFAEMLEEYGMIIVATGAGEEVPAFLPEDLERDDEGRIKLDRAGRTSNRKIILVGDISESGRVASAMGQGRTAAEAAMAALTGQKWTPPAPAKATGRKTAVSGQCRGHAVCRDCRMCENICPQGAIRREKDGNGGFAYVSDDNLCIACGFCADICPCQVWVMQPYA